MQSGAESAALLRKKEAKTVILTLGAKGAAAFTADAEIFVPAFKVEPVDTTAAGDSFIGAFVTAWLETNDMKTASRGEMLAERSPL
ncbi:PfkB family carbohydrate kinase [Treponema phagedenis]|uniref:PfkB family carbohydrate kinase n=1 Tax=Treponema phagedenis TaxID=162 RepID=UPI0017D1DBB5|nr:PfkB family carbohydrate kinase [Treponema phagedenis]NVP24402.1 hypothetical protein [Treponema phagedenis]